MISEQDKALLAAFDKKDRQKYMAKKIAQRSQKQAQDMAAFGALLRDNKKKKKHAKEGVLSESVRILEARDAVMQPAVASDSFRPTGPSVKVVLITEGLGNKRDMNYYGPEAMDSAPQVFNGAPCFLDHPSYTEERDIPERRVRDKVGYFRNVEVQSMSGKRAVTGELVFDLSEAGQNAYAKALSALEYQSQFPGMDKEYVGLSVNADGEVQPKEMTLDGETVEVNYVTRFTGAQSCDIVTVPARGGKFLALVESAAGASMKNKEARPMIVKRLTAAQSALKEAATLSDRKAREAKMTEAQTEIDALLATAAEEAAKNQTEETTTEETVTEESAADDKAAAAKKKKKADAEDDSDDDSKESKKADAEESEVQESNRLAVEALVARSGLNVAYFDINDLAKSGLKEAKAEIARTKRISECVAKEMTAALGDVVPSHGSKITESGRSGKSSNMNDLFADCSL